MQNMKKRHVRNLSVSVLIALILAAMCACKPNNRESKSISPKYVSYTDYRNFEIENICMSRVSIDGIPSKNHALYVLKIYVKGCNPVARRYNPEIEGRRRRPFKDGLNDTIYNLVFKNKGKVVLPKPLKWSEHNEKVNCEMQIARTGEGKSEPVSCFYNGDYEHLPLDIKKPDKYKTTTLSEIKDNKDSLFFLVTFEKHRALPDSAIIVLPGEDIKTVVNNNQIDNYSVVSFSCFKESEDVIFRKIQEKRKAIKELIKDRIK